MNIAVVKEEAYEGVCMLNGSQGFECYALFK